SDPDPADQTPAAPDPAPAAEAPAPDPYAIGPDRHERPAESGPGGQEPDGSAFRPEPRAQAAAETVPGPRRPEERRITDKGLPKRTPNVVRPEGAPTTGRTGGLDKEDLRRRLGSFHQAAKEGRRDVEAEIAGSTGSIALADREGDRTAGRAADREGVTTAGTGHETPRTTDGATGTAHGTRTEQSGGRAADHRNGETGDTVEEARS
ncbi:histidine kinase, partial [Streptomyces sp. ZEA17I]